MAGHAIDDEQPLVGIDGGFQFLDLGHHLGVDMQSAGRIEQQDVVRLERGLGQGAPGDRDRRFARIGHRKPRSHLCRQRLQLQNSRRPIHVGADHQNLLVLFFDQPPRKFAGRGGLTGALQSRQHHHDRSLRTQVEPGAGLAHEPDEFLVHHFDECLAGSQALGDLDAHRPRLDRLGESLHARQRHVRVEQRKAHLPHGVGDVVLGQMAAPAERVQCLGKTRGKSVEHGLIV